MSIATGLFVSLLLLVLNAFFVASEFAVVAAKRHRLEERASEGSRAAKAALNANRELTLMLAGAQLGITLCTLGLGALSEPAVASLLEPVLHAAGIPDAVTHLIAVVIAVAIVVFLHMVVGEMAPKSWAISHPEVSAITLALPFRAFTWVVRPGLIVLNGAANLLVRVFGVDPVETVDAERHGPAELQMLLSQSHEHGVLPDQEHQMLSGALRLENETVTAVMFPLNEAVTIPLDQMASDVETVSSRSGRSRVFVTREGEVHGLVHVRDAMRATAAGHRDLPVTDFLQEAVTLRESLPLIDAVSAMRQQRAQLALVADQEGTVIGLASLEDILEEILGEFDDETDEPEPATR
ncbi:MAG: hemolysin family protein [Ornithinimicrobium sp.]|uniref:hemolysin family protein n=1 Tax=Ornithinimicrobium sp. TaxID=1977084 RepID=UPI003D9AF721